MCACAEPNNNNDQLLPTINELVIEGQPETQQGLCGHVVTVDTYSVNTRTKTSMTY